MIKGQKQDYSNWTQIGKLSPVDIGRRRSLNADTDSKGQEIDTLISRIKAIDADIKARQNEWWLHLRKTYGLPKGTMHLSQSGEIFMAPKEPNHD